MKQYFFWGAAVMIPLAISGWFLYLVGKAIYGLYDDWILGKELDELEREGQSRRERRLQDNVDRLANDCEHNFGIPAYGMPPNTCSKCGLEEQKPIGACDHVWRSDKGAVPASVCEICGRRYSAANEG